MKNQTLPGPRNISDGFAKMRQRAEIQVRNLTKRMDRNGTDADTHRLLHELEVYQVELEMQNAELKTAREEIEQSLEKYTDLYDFAPVGYFTLAADGTIQLVNLTGARLAGVERSRLAGKSFGLLVCAESRPAFNSFLKKVFAGQARQSGDFEILSQGGPPRIVNIEAQRLPSGQACRAVAMDITGRKRAEEKVRVSEIRYRRLFEAAHDGVLLLDPGTRKITDANPFMTKLLGYSHDQLLGKELFEIGLLKDEAESREAFQKLKRNHEIRYENLPLKSQGGRHQEVEVVANLYEENGHSIIQCNIRDITERKQAEAALSASEERYRTLFTSIDEGFCVIEIIFDKRKKPVDYRFLEVNPTFTKQTGMHNAAGKRMRELVPNLEAHWFEIYGQVARTGKSIRFVNSAKAMDGRWFDVYACRVGGSDSRKVAVIFNDITARKHTEQELSEKARLLDLSHDAIIVRDIEGGIRYWNHGAEELYGWSRKEALGKISNVLLQTKYPVPLEQMTKELHRTGRWIGELVHTKRDGRRITVLARKTLDRDSRGRPAAVLENITDITERKQAEDALRRNEALFAALVEQAPVGVLVMDTRFCLQQVNPVALLDFNKIQPLIGRNFFEIMRTFWPKRVADQITKHFRHTMKTGEPYQLPEFTERRRDTGVLESYEWQTQRVTLPAGARGLVCFFNNITERKQAEAVQRRMEMLTASNRKLEKEIVRRELVEKALQKSERHQRKLFEQSHAMQEQLRQLSHQILHAQEEERKRISRELHDEIAQTLTGINVYLATLKQEAAPGNHGLDHHIARTQRLVAEAVEIVHRFARELRPAVLDDLGLIPALHTFMKEFMNRTGVRVRFTTFAGVTQLNSAQRTVLFRVAQEALTNVARHAQATRVEASIQKLPGAVRMQIKDNGKSFEVEKVLHAKKNKSLGLLGIRERLEMVGGSFEIISAPDQGTTIQVQIPFGHARAGGGRKIAGQFRKK